MDMVGSILEEVWVNPEQGVSWQWFCVSFKNKEELLFSDGGGALEQASMGSCDVCFPGRLWCLLPRVAVVSASQGGSGVSFSGGSENPPEHVPVQPALGKLALAGGLYYTTSRGPFQPPQWWDSTVDKKI